MPPDDRFRYADAIPLLPILIKSETDSRMIPRWTLGRVLPFLMLTLVAMEFTLRLLPIGVFVNRPFEAIGRFYSLNGPYKANAEYHNAHFFGDLAALGNLPNRRLYHSVDVTTDALGFHNRPSTRNVQWAGMLFGDSYAAGAEVPEDKTLSVQLSPLFIGPIYNAGGYLPLDVERKRELAKQLKLRKGVFIYEFQEVHLREAPPNVPVEPTWRHELGLRALGPTKLSRFQQARWSLFDSRLERLAQKFENVVENDDILPNGFANAVVEGWFPNGDWMLFLRSRFGPIPSPDLAVNRWADFICWASRELGRDGLELVVMIVPDKFTIYGPLLASPAISTGNEVPLGQLEVLLRHEGVPVVNVTPAFRAAASQALQRHQYLYWQDDTHWNACGVMIAAEDFRTQLSGLPQLSGLRSRDPNWGSEFESNCGTQQISQNSTDHP